MNPTSERPCICCGEDSKYNRRVESVETRRVVGVLCESCERARFGESLRTLEGSETDDCAYCEDRPAYVLPEHTVILNDDRGEEREISGYFVTDATPRLCHAHLEIMRFETGTFWPDSTPIVEASD